MKFEHYLKTSDDLLRLLKHYSVVACKIRLTLCRIDDYIINLLVRRRSKFDMCRETGAAESYNACSLDSCTDVGIGHVFVVQSLSDTVSHVILSVVFDNDSLYRSSARCKHGSDIFYSS